VVEVDGVTGSVTGATVSIGDVVIGVVGVVLGDGVLGVVASVDVPIG
jgi:hypothetical protein